MTDTITTPTDQTQQPNEFGTPWSLHFDGDGTEDYAVIRDADGEDLAASRPFWQPERDDPVPQTLAAVLAMKAAPNLLAALVKCAGLLPRITAYDGVYREAIAAINEATEWPGYDSKPDDNALAA